MDSTILVLAAAALLCAYFAWIVIKLRGIESRTVQIADSLRANESVADRMDAVSPRVISAQRLPAFDDRDPLVDLIRLLEGSRHGDEKRDESGLAPSPSKRPEDAARR